MSFLSNLLPTIAGAGLMAASGGTINPMTAGLIMGGLQTARTGSLNKGLMAGLGAYGGAGLVSGLAGAGASAMNTSAAQATQAANPELMASEIGREMGQAGFMQPEIAANMNPVTATMTDKMGLGAANLGTKAGMSTFANQMGGTSGLLKTGLAAAAPALMTTTQQPQLFAGDTNMGQRYAYNPGVAKPLPRPDVPSYESGMGENFGREQIYFPSQGYRPIGGAEAKKLYGYAAGGPVEEMSQANAVGANTGYPQADVTGHAYATPWQTPVSQNVVQGTADTGVDRMTGQMFADGGAVSYDPETQKYTPAASSGLPSVRPGSFVGKFMANNGENLYNAMFDPQYTSETMRGLSEQVRAKLWPKAAGAQSGVTYDPLTQKFSGAAGADEVYMGGGQWGPTEEARAAQAAKNAVPPPLEAANGGRIGKGGLSDLGSYSDGGRLLRGPGDGVSDSIPAVIGQKKPARLADGEFVVPARIVSELGNGSTDAGARKLYAMLDRVQAARKKSIGKGKVAKNSRADKLLPA